MYKITNSALLVAICSCAGMAMAASIGGDELSELDKYDECVRLAGRFTGFAWGRPDRALGFCLTFMLLNVPLTILLLICLGSLLPPNSKLLILFPPYIKTRLYRNSSQLYRCRSSKTLANSSTSRGQNSTSGLITTCGRPGIGLKGLKGRLTLIPVSLLYLASWALVVLVPFFVEALEHCSGRRYPQAALWVGYAACNVCLLGVCNTLLVTVTILLLIGNISKDGHRDANRSSLMEANWMGRSRPQSNIVQPRNTSGPLLAPPFSNGLPHRSNLSVLSRSSSSLQLPQHLRLKRQHFDASRTFSSPDMFFKQAEQVVKDPEWQRSVRNATLPNMLQPAAPLITQERASSLPWYAKNPTIRRVESAATSSTHPSTRYSSLRLPSPLHRPNATSRSVSAKTAKSRIEKLDMESGRVPPVPKRSVSMVASSYYPSSTQSVAGSASASL